MSMELPSVAPLPNRQRETISADFLESHRLLSKVQPLPLPRPRRILDLDCETVAAGFADPDWVPQKITCVAFSWLEEEEVEVYICGATGLFGNPKRRARMLKPLLAAISQADVLTGHNLFRFDLPVIQSECMRLSLPPLGPVLVQDTMRVLKSKGFKKGQDNLGRMYRVPLEKKAMDWQAWQDAYDEKGWEGIKERAIGDVQQHKLIRAEMLQRGHLKPPRMWRP